MTNRVLRGGVGDLPPPRTMKYHEPRPPTDAEIQKIVDHLIHQHGDNVPNWASWDQLLTEYQVTPSRVTPKMIELGRNRAHEAQTISLRSRDLLINLPAGTRFTSGDHTGIVLSSNSCSVRVAIRHGMDAPHEEEWAPATVVEPIKKPENVVDFQPVQPYNQKAVGERHPGDTTERETSMATTTTPKTPKTKKITKIEANDTPPVEVKRYPRDEIVTLFMAMGSKLAVKLKADKIDGYLNTLNTKASPEELAKLDPDPELSALRDRILADLAAGKTLTVVPEGEEPKPTPPKKGGKGKPAKKGANAKTHETNGKGRNSDPTSIMSVIKRTLYAATEKKPVTKKDVFAALKITHPDHPEDKLKAYVTWAVPTALRTKKKLDVKENDKGYWMPKS